MGGVRQFTSLLRKNLLVKTRRPCATCFELFLPLFLFTMLVFVRMKVEDRSYGAIYHDHHEIFPMANVVARTLTSNSDGVDFNRRLSSHKMKGEDKSENVGTAMFGDDWNRNEMMDLMKDEFIRPMVCGSEAPQCNWQCYLDRYPDLQKAFGKTDTDRARQHYASYGKREGRDCTCATKGMSTASTEEDMLSNMMQGVLTWRVNGSTLANYMLFANASHEGEEAKCAVEEVHSWNVSDWIRNISKEKKNYLESQWPQKLVDAAKRVDEEMEILRSELTAVVAGRSREIVEGWVDDLCGLHVPSDTSLLNEASPWPKNSLNGSCLAKELKNLQEAMDSCGLTEWINKTNVPEFWNRVTPEDIADMTKHMSQAVSGTNAESMAESMDSATLWLSHFLRSRGGMAKFLGEQPGNEKDMKWMDLRTDMESEMDLSAVAIPTSLRTAMAGTMFRGMRMLQDVKETASLTAWMQEEWSTMSSRMNDLALNYTVFQGELKRVMDDVRHRNLTEIEQTAIPRWNSTWKEVCTKGLNKTRLADKVEKMRTSCPFYKRKIRHLAEENFTREVAKMHEDLATWDVNESLHFMVSWHEEFKKEVNATKMGDTVQRLLRDSQGWHQDGQSPAAMLAKEAKATNNEGEQARKYSRALSRMAKDELAKSMDIKCSEGRKLQPRTSKRYNSVLDEFVNRKILVAPYKGEVKDVIFNLFVELAYSVTITNENSKEDKIPKELEALLRCPVIKALVAKGAEYFMKDRMVKFDSEKELEDYAQKYPKDVLLALVFRNADANTGNFPPGGLSVDYSIRAHAQFLPQTSKILRIGRNAMFGGARKSFYPYIDVYFAHIQEMLGRSVARLRASRNATAAGSMYSPLGRNIAAGNMTAKGRELAFALEQFPTPAFTVDRFVKVIQHTMPMFLILGWIYAVSLLVREIVYEKQEKLRDVMRIQGLKTWVYWSSWMASAMIQLTGLVTLMVLIVCGGGVIKNSNPVIFFAFLWLYSLATVSFSMLISSFFSRAKVAAACAGLIYYASYMPYMFFNRFEDVMSTNGKNALCLLSSTGLGVGSSIIAKWELIEEGVQWSNIASPPPVTNSGATPKDNFSLASVMIMMLVDTVVYQVLAWYIEKVRPGTLGLPQPWYFPVMPSYWRGVRGLPDAIGDDDSADAERIGNTKIECYEKPPADLAVAVKIRDLVKTFRSGKRALKSISLDMHRGTILGLLGHNGAGKTTTMAILTGLYPPTAGDVQVNGCSVRKDSHGVRKQLGVCLQQNALYEWITVEEHLSLFCCLKSVPWSQMKSTVDALLQDTGLMSKRTAPSKALSGGMKRKLSIGIALSGGSQVVALDEPTAGVDATSRRDIWQLLAAQKSHRTILLSTHFMDEADILADRISIIAEGELTAIGSGMTLKSHFADSYMLTLVAADGADASRQTKAVCDAVPEAKFAGSRGRELCYSLPGSAKGSFAKLFAQLQDDTKRQQLGIDTYGLSAATMEEVFLQASSLHEEGLSGTVRNVQSSSSEQRPHRPGWDGVVPPPEGVPPQVAQWEEISTTSGSSSNGNKSDPNSGSGDSGRQMTPTDDNSQSGNSGSDKACADEQGPICPQSMVTAQPEASGEDGTMPDFHEPSKQQPKEKKEKVSAENSEKVDKAAPEGMAFQKSDALWHGPRLWRQQLSALIRKRGLSVRRDKNAWASQLLLPALFVLIALVVAAILQVKEEEPPLKLSTDMFVGTTQAGAVAHSLEEHVIPFGVSHNEAFGKNMWTSFQQSKGAADKFVEVPVGPSYHSANMSHYLMTNTQSLLLQSYGAVEVGGSSAKPNVTMWFRTRAYHAVPAFTSLFNDARLQMLGFADTNVVVWSHPLPKSQVVMEEEMTGGSQVFVDLTVAITVILAMGFIPASFVVYLVHEKSSSAKHQQLLTGVSPTMYWMASYLWDLLNYMFPHLVCFAIFVVFQVAAYSGRNSLAIFMLLLGYGFCMTPLMYCLEPFFSVPSTAYVTLICVNIFTGTISVMATAVLDMVQEDDPELKPINQFCKTIFPWFLPNYVLGRGMIDIASNHYMNFAYDEFGICIQPEGECIRNPMSWNVVGKSVAYLFIMTPVWLALRMFIEWGCCTRQLRKGLAVHQGVQSELSDDQAVNQEAERISAGGVTDSLLLTNLAKSFGSKRAGCCRKRVPATHAVRGLNVGVPSGECFGLLGVNGAGKTTTMRMITGDTDIGGGDIQVCGWSVQNKRDRARWHLGYCPQFDALPDKLTTRETLALYARIRGVPSKNVQTTVNTMVKRMCLEAHQNNTCEHLSGGNKRKLSTALALIGEPDVVLLDEPSTGVDVGARRFLWDVIGDIRRRGHALVLTSHSMEECEVLCTRLTIMVNGKLQCLGSPTQLKGKYGGGYTLMVKAIISKDTDSCSRIRDFIMANVPGATLNEESVGLFRYGLRGSGSTDAEVPLASIFDSLEKATKEGGELHGCVSDYTLSQTSLEEVFLHFSQQAEAPSADYNVKGSELRAL